MSKIRDIEALFQEHDCAICEVCAYSSTYYEHDTGYQEIQCKAKTGFPHDCIEAVEIFIEENNLDEEYKGEIEMENTSPNEMELKVDLNTLSNSIINAIKTQVKETITSELRVTIVKMVYEEVAKPQLEDIRNMVAKSVYELIEGEVKSYYTEKKILIGGGYSEPAQEFTIQEYTQKLLAEGIEKGSFGYKTSKYDSKTINIEKHLLDNCIAQETQKSIEVNLKKIQKEINEKVKSVFETKVNDMMSEVALGVLKSNATYNDITKKLLGSA